MIIIDIRLCFDEHLNLGWNQLLRNDDWSEYKATFYDDDNTNKDDDGDNDDHDNDDENDDDDGDDENDDDLGNLRLAFVLGEDSK